MNYLICSILGHLGPKLVTWRHGTGQILKIVTFWLHNRIPYTKISLNANFQVVIQISRWIIDISPILGYFGASIRHMTNLVTKVP